MTVTITSLYDDRAQAEAACGQLQARFGEDNIRLVPGTDDGTEKKGIWASIKETFLSDEDRSLYGEGIRRGSYLLHALVEEEQADEVCRLLEESGPVDLDERERSWRSEGWQPGRDDDRPEPGPAGGGTGGAARPQGGRRQAERGGARVRSYVRDEVGGTPNLRDEAGTPGNTGGEPGAAFGLSERRTNGEPESETVHDLEQADPGRDRGS